MDVPTTVTQDQALEKTLRFPWDKFLGTVHRTSRQFGWPILLFFFFAPESATHTLPVRSLMLVLGSVCLGFGLYLRMWARGYEKSDGFVFEGPYRHVRNPVQLGALLCYLGFALILQLPLWYTALMGVVAFFYMSFSAIGFERELLKKVGPLYFKYQQRTKRWIPSSIPGANMSAHSFSIKRAFVVEGSSIIWLLLFLFVLMIKQNAFTVL